MSKERLKVVRQNHMRVDPDSTGPYRLSPAVEFGVGEYDPIRVQQAYLLTQSQGVYFWANDAQFESAKRNAAQALNEELYGDALSHIRRLRHAVGNRDWEEAMLLLGTMEKGLLDET